MSGVRKFTASLLRKLFFLDENIPLQVVNGLKELGFECEHAKLSHLRGADDKEIADYARMKKAILVTRDLEFGNIILYPPGSHHGLLLLRIPQAYTAIQIKDLLCNFLQHINFDELTNSMITLEIGRYRKRDYNK